MTKKTLFIGLLLALTSSSAALACDADCLDKVFRETDADAARNARDSARMDLNDADLYRQSNPSLSHMYEEKARRDLEQ